MTEGGRPPQPTGRVGNIVAGAFLMVFAILLILTGGGCTILLFALGPTSSDSIPLILISLAVLAGGVVAMWFGIRLMRGRYD
jgi:hypothetical protein